MPVQIGDILLSKKDGRYEVLEKLKHTRYKVKFLDTGYTTSSQATKVSSGEIRDHYKPSKFGVGYLGDLAGQTNKSHLLRTSFRTWHNMLIRCYYEVYQNRFPTYKGCYVCKEWLNFSNFHSWFIENYKESYVLDKDSVIEGNKCYSPETCAFITAEENGRLAKKSRMSKWLVLSPTGEQVLIYNVSKFCRENNFSQGTFQMMLHGNRNIAWGWKLIKKLED